MNIKNILEVNNKTGVFLQNLPRVALSPIPLLVIQPILKHISGFIIKKHPDIFSRLGVHTNSVFVINPSNTPFVLRLVPDSKGISLTAHRRNEGIEYDAKITGTFLTLLKMIDGGLDGDALFFTRDLKLEGNTEAIVCLRNAMDDLEGSVVDDIVDACGPFSRPLNRALEILRGE